MINIFFRRPKPSADINVESRFGEVPSSLSFDKIIAGETCSPCSTRDFLNYLRYVEYSAENLYFFLWYLDYCKRFSQLPREDRVLSPAWSTQREFLKSTTSIITSNGTDTRSFSLDDTKTLCKTSSLTDEQAFRDELRDVVNLYLASGSARELNLSSRERDDVLEALQTTSHPSAFTSALNQVERSLRCQSHPNFIRYALTNANDSRLTLIRWIGIVSLFIAFAMGILLTLSSKQRWWRIVGLVPMMIGVIALINASKGMCLIHILLGFKRNVAPWELMPNSVEPDFGFGNPDIEMQAFAKDIGQFRDWMKEYNLQPLRKRLYEKRIITQETAVVKAQRLIVLQSVFFASCAAFVYCAVFLSLPVARII